MEPTQQASSSEGDTMTRLASLATLCAEATPGPWSVDYDPRPDGANQILFREPRGGLIRTLCFMSTGRVNDHFDDPDAELIAAARTWLPKLVAVAEAARRIRVNDQMDGGKWSALTDALAALDGEEG